MERSVALIAIFAALIAVLGLIPNLTLAFGVPITAQNLGVMLAGCVLGARRGALAVALFLLLVALGLPLLSGGRGGLGVFASPSAGFLFGWIASAWVIGWIVERWRSVPVVWAAGLASVIGGIGVTYAFGVVGLMIALDKTALESLALVTVFLPGDAIKAAVAALLTSALVKARPASVLSRSPDAG